MEDGLPLQPPDEDVEKEVEAVLASCVYSVSVRYFAEENQELFEQLEALQRRVWAKDEVQAHYTCSSLLQQSATHPGPKLI